MQTHKRIITDQLMKEITHETLESFVHHLDHGQGHLGHGGFLGQLKARLACACNS